MSYTWQTHYFTEPDLHTRAMIVSYVGLLVNDIPSSMAEQGWIVSDWPSFHLLQQRRF